MRIFFLVNLNFHIKGIVYIPEERGDKPLCERDLQDSARGGGPQFEGQFVSRDRWSPTLEGKQTTEIV